MNYFPVYLDAAAMHPVLACAREAFLNAPFGNASSEHQIGREARNALESAREKIAALMGCKPEEIYFTSTATEAAALALNSAWLRGYICIASPFEHHAVSENIYRPLSVDIAPGNVLCQMHSNNETGEIITFPSDKLRKNDLFLCDATSSVGHTPLPFRGMDALISDGIKFGSVPGAAFLIVNSRFPIIPLIRGGGQERGMRSGTENVPAICAMAAALEWQTEHMEENTARLSKLFEILQTELAKIPGVLWNTPLDKPHLPHILNVSFPGVDAHALALLLSKDGVMVSPGAACSNGLHDPSHVIMAMFHDEQRARSAIRISMSHDNTEEEIRIAAEKIKNAVAHLRSIG